MVLTYRTFIEPEEIQAETGVKPIAIPMQPTTETVLEVDDATTQEQIEQIDASMLTRGFRRV